MRSWLFSASTPTSGVLAVLSFGIVCLQAAPTELSVRWVNGSDPTDAYVEVLGLAGDTVATLRESDRTIEQWQALLTVRVDHEDVQTMLLSPPMVGDYKILDQSLQFHPQFGLQRGLGYVTTLNAEALPADRSRKQISARFQVPRKPVGTPTVVTHIYPSSSMLPENLLKFYIHFSSPMSRGDIYDHIHLTDGEGREVELPFLEIDEELWNPSMTRITLFIDPGRIKRGVKPLEDIGPSLQAGGQYTLTIDAAWQDAEGARLASSHRKAFRVSPADRDAPDPASWKVSSPAAGSREALTITFPEPMDSALATRLIRAVGIEGLIELRDEERLWAFIPTEAWKLGAFHVEVENLIEDLAGNNIGKTFEVDIFEKIDDDGRIRPDALTLPFEVK